LHEGGLSIVFLKNSFKRTKVAGQANYPLDSEKPLKERIALAAELVNDFIESNKVSSSDVFIGLPRESVILRDLEFPLAVKENLRSTLRYKIENYVPMKLRDIHFDYQIIEENKADNKLKVLLVVVQKDTLDQYLKLKDRLGIGISGISVNSTAYANFFSRHPLTEADSDYVFVHEQEGDVHFGVVKNKVLQYSRSADFKEGDEVERFLSKELKPVEDQLGDMQKPVKLVYVASTEKSVLSAGLSAKEAFRMEIPDTKVSGINNPQLIPAMGLALRGVKKVPTEINVLPVPLRKRPSRAVYYALFVLVVLFAVSGLMWAGSSVMRQKMILKNLDAETARLAAEIKDIEKMKESLRDLETRIDYLQNMWRGRVPLLEILKEATERIPETAWLQDFNFDQKKGIQLYGYAESASELIPLLEASPLFNDVVFLSTITKGKDGKERFRIGFKINS
jgi:general secretion pathway protein L